MDTVRIFDTTLRDGEQSPGFSMTVAEKVRLARQLEALGVDIIEGGFPISSRGDLEGVRAVAAEVRGCRVAALARTRREDIDAALEALAGAAHPRLHAFLATSDLHLHHKLRLTREQALESISAMVRYGRQHCAEVEFSAEDASRTDIDFLCEAVGRAVRAVRVRQASFGVKTDIQLDKIYATSRLLSEITGVAVPPNKAVVGANAFAHEAGIHQDGILKNPLTYEIILPEAVGVPKRQLVLGKHSGRNALRAALVELGYDPNGEELEECYRRIIALADESKLVNNRDLLNIAHQVLRKRGSQTSAAANGSAHAN